MRAASRAELPPPVHFMPMPEAPGQDPLAPLDDAGGRAPSADLVPLGPTLGDLLDIGTGTGLHAGDLPADRALQRRGHRPCRGRDAGRGARQSRPRRRGALAWSARATCTSFAAARPVLRPGASSGPGAALRRGAGARSDLEAARCRVRAAGRFRSISRPTPRKSCATSARPPPPGLPRGRDRGLVQARRHRACRRSKSLAGEPLTVNIWQAIRTATPVREAPARSPRPATEATGHEHRTLA